MKHNKLIALIYRVPGFVCLQTLEEEDVIVLVRRT